VTLRLLAALAGLLAAAPALAAGQLVPHRAVYDMSLRSAERDSGIVAVRGEMIAEWSESCEGWTFEHRSAFEVGTGEDESARIASSIATWESRDGLLYRFAVRNVESDGTDERIEGSARLTGRGKGGVAEFAKPEQRSLALPPGTIFPTEHTARMLAAAGEKPASLKRTVFDGLSGDGLFEVNAVIGGRIAPARSADPVLRPVAGLRSWISQVAFFRLESADAEPDNEIVFRMYENGVSDEMTIDFGRFKVRARLKSLELAPRPSCR
jgi:hypothetical protein